MSHKEKVRTIAAAVKQAEADSSIRALVVACRGRTFMSGADLSELGSEIKPPTYPETLAALGCTVVGVDASPRTGGLLC